MKHEPTRPTMTPDQKPRKPVRKYANVLRPLLAQERHDLRVSLQKDGLLHDMIRDQHGDLLDGHTREDLCVELGIELRYKTVTTSDPVGWIRSMQKARRNLDQREMRQLIAEQIKATPHLSDTAIARVVGSTHPTVGNVRKKLIADGKVSNVVRFEANGRAARGNKPEVNSNGKSFHKNKSEPPQQQLSPETKVQLYGNQPKLEMKDGKLRGLTERMVYDYADDGAFHSIPQMTKELDPDGSLKLVAMNFQRSVYAMQNERKDVYVETRPGAGSQKQYRFYRQGKTIGLAVLKAKFRPVIEALTAESSKPISHQTRGAFIEAANMLTQLLRDLEA